MSENLDYSIALKSNSVKDSITNFTKAVLDNKTISPLEAGIFVKKMKTFVDELYKSEKGKELKKVITDETKDNLDVLENEFGIQATYSPVYTSYNFKNCGHTELNEINDLIQMLTERKKGIEAEILAKCKIKEANSNKIELAEDNKPRIDRKPIVMVVEYTYELNPIESGEIVDILPPEKRQEFGIKYKNLK